MTINAIEYKSGMSDSNVATSTFLLNSIIQSIDSTDYTGNYTSIAVDGSNVYIS
jgi:hypothetical protein